MYSKWQFYLLSFLAIFSPQSSLSVDTDLLDPEFRLADYLNNEERLSFNEDYGPHDFTSTEQDDIVKKHNDLRANTLPSAASMLKMVSLQ